MAFGPLLEAVMAASKKQERVEKEGLLSMRPVGQRPLGSFPARDASQLFPRYVPAPQSTMRLCSTRFSHWSNRPVIRSTGLDRTKFRAALPAFPPSLFLLSLFINQA